jgi:hypothetical protein
MTESSPNNEYMEAFPLQEGSILLEVDNKPQTLRQLTIAALRKVISDRKLDLPLGPQLDLDNPQRILNLNRFFVQVVTTGINADEISIPLKQWSKKDCAPQLLLAAKVDEENNVVYFSGVLTGPEFEKLISNRLNGQDKISLSIDSFEGGIDRLLRFVRLMQPAAIPRTAFVADLASKSFSLKPIQVGVLAAIAFAGFYLRPNPGYQFANKWTNDGTLIALHTVESSGSTRGNNIEEQIKVCLLTPSFNPAVNNSFPTSFVSFDRPFIFSPDPLNEIAITKNGTLLWRERASLEKKIIGPISWPIAPIKPGEEYKLRFRSQNSLAGEWSTVYLKTDPKTSFLKLDSLIQSLGSNRSKWSRTIDQKLETNKDLGFALLLSDRAPNIRDVNVLRSHVLSAKGCLK